MASPGRDFFKIKFSEFRVSPFYYIGGVGNGRVAALSRGGCSRGYTARFSKKIWSPCSECNSQQLCLGGSEKMGSPGRDFFKIKNFRIPGFPFLLHWGGGKCPGCRTFLTIPWGAPRAAVFSEQGQPLPQNGNLSKGVALFLKKMPG